MGGNTSESEVEDSVLNLSLTHTQSAEVVQRSSGCLPDLLTLLPSQQRERRKRVCHSICKKVSLTSQLWSKWRKLLLSVYLKLFQH